MSFFLLAISWLKRVPWQCWAAIALIALLWGFGASRYHAGASDVQARWDAQEAVYAAQREAATVAARKTEERHRAEYKAIADRFLADQRKADEEADRTIACLRDGTCRMRDRFTCPRVSGTPTDPERDNGAYQAGLSERDADFLIRFAERADTAARRLTACQQILGVQP